jgi:2-polyprenyl-6-methoxyphenol hydroxylase-like FAD-dependent oxidoreductase
VIVVGARVAGAATALGLARAGLRVLLVDRARPGADTVSTHALMRGGVVQLDRWGLLPAIAASDTPAVRRTTFHYGAETIPVEIKDRDGVDALYAPRRTVLDTILAEAASNAGVDVHYGVTLRDLDRDAEGRVTGAIIEDVSGRRRVRADLVVGADGIRSTVARLVSAEETDQAPHAAGTAYGYWPGLDLDGYHWHFAPGSSSGAIPTTGGLTCVFIAVPADRFRAEVRVDLHRAFHRILAEASPDLARAIDGRAPTGAMRAFPGVQGYIRRSHGPGWALVGDAGFFRDPITAHGMTDALRDAALLADAYGARGDAGLEDYARDREPWAREMLEVSDAIASFEWDLEQVKPLHRQLSRVMARESEMLAGRSEAGRAGAWRPRSTGASAAAPAA